MIYKISDYYKKSFYYLINDNYGVEDKNEMEIKLKGNDNEYNRILELIKNKSFKKAYANQIDTYYTYKYFNQEWLRVISESSKYIFNYKKKIDNSHYEKYDILIDNINNLNVILKALNVNIIDIIKKKRTMFIL